jgi:IS5 family transposase
MRKSAAEQIPFRFHLKKIKNLHVFVTRYSSSKSKRRRRWIDREDVPVSEKVFSIFEPHTELIMRGRREKPVEFGHKIVINQSKDKFITGYQVLEQNQADQKLLEKVIEQHKEQYGRQPIALAADMGFHPDAESYEEMNEEIEFLKVPSSSREYSDKILSEAQKFRAGIEGTISYLKRSFRLSRCYFKGFRNFSSAVGSAIFCHNLLVLSRQT